MKNSDKSFSSLSSSFNDVDSDDSLESSPSSSITPTRTTTTKPKQIPKNRVHEQDDDDDDDDEESGLAQNEEKEIIYENVDPTTGDCECEPEDATRPSNDDDNIRLSIENLEEIRAKAASMSLPLLTALCSDRTLIQALEKNNKIPNKTINHQQASF